VKGRAALTSAADGVEVKGQSSFERLDLASLLADMGWPRWIAGSAQGQFTFEGSGDSAAEIVQDLHGRASVTVRQGDLAGPGLTDVLRRADGRLPAAPAGRGTRTSFEQAHLTLALAGGTAEIVDGSLAATGLRAALQGRATLMDGFVAIRAFVEGTGIPSAIVRIIGPWDRIAVVPDLARSGSDGGSSGPEPAVQ